MKVGLKDGREGMLRLLLPCDAAALAGFYAGVPREDYRFYCPHPLDEAHAVQKAGRADEREFVCVVLEGVTLPADAGAQAYAPSAGPIVGYAWYEWRRDAEESVFGICVAHGYQGVGAGRALMRHVLEIAGQVGPPIMTLTVQLGNPAAVALYQSMGFRIVGEQMRAACGGGLFGAEAEYLMKLRVRG
ncbi:MAG TPA: GNAT family N-acetyltransferase [Tepidisphaeraceae bacterium]